MNLFGTLPAFSRRALPTLALVGGVIVLSLAPPDAAQAQAPLFTDSGTGKIDSFTIPTTGLYEIIAIGGDGGSVGFLNREVGGVGVSISGSVFLTGGTTLDIVAGEPGGLDVYNGAGGGGGSFVYDADGLLLAAGGGGGAGYYQDGGGGQDGQQGQGGGYPDGGAGGSSGSGGAGGGSGGFGAGGGGGGGFVGDGAPGEYGYDTGSGGAGGPSTAGGTFIGGIGGVIFTGGPGYGNGSYGGGGGSGAAGGGGGGGYSGGAGGGLSGGAGGGGGSFAAPSLTGVIFGVNTASNGNGSVSIRTQVSPAVPEPSSFALLGLGLLPLGLAARKRLTRRA